MGGEQEIIGNRVGHVIINAVELTVLIWLHLMQNYDYQWSIKLLDTKCKFTKTTVDMREWYCPGLRYHSLSLRS